MSAKLEENEQSSMSTSRKSKRAKAKHAPTKKERGTSLGKARAEELEEIENLRKDLIDYMDRKDDEEALWMCPHKLRHEFWNSAHDIGSLKAFRGYGQALVDKIKEKFLVVVSILIYSVWPNLWLFRSVFVEGAYTDLTDANLIFDSSKIERLEQSGIYHFKDNQYLFHPAQIRQKRDGWIQPVEKQRRLPYTIAPERIGEGGFGEVSKVKVAAHFVHHDDKGTVNSKVS